MRIGALLRGSLEALGTLLYPPHCLGCGSSLADGRRYSYLCETCREEVPRVESPSCEICSHPLHGAIDETFACVNCRGRKFHFRFAVARFRSRGVVRDLIHRFKYRGQYFIRHPLSEWLMEALEDPRLAGWEYDLLAPVPLHPARRRERGFNQSRVLAEGVSLRSGHPVEDLLRRLRRTETQTHFDRASRMENLRNAFKVRNIDRVQGKRVLLIDDVLTTGSTLDECARVLRRAGAREVRAAVVARG